MAQSAGLEGNVVELMQNPKNAQLSQTNPEPEPQDDDATKKIKKFAFGVLLIFVFFALLWWLWMSICSGSDDQDDGDEGSFCQILDGAANVMNDITAGITFMVQNILILVALGVMFIVIGIFCNISSKCPGSLTETKDWLNDKLFNTEKESPTDPGDKDKDDPDKDKEHGKDGPDDPDEHGEFEF